MTIRLSRSLLCGGLLLFVAPAAAQAPVQGVCNPTKMKFIASGRSAYTASETFINIPDAAVSFTQGGNRATCVFVRFWSTPYAPGSAVILIQAKLDNSVVALPGEIQLAANDAGRSRAHAYEFIFPSVAPGVHVVRMQYRALSSNDGVFVNSYNTIVQHAP